MGLLANLFAARDAKGSSRDRLALEPLEGRVLLNAAGAQEALDLLAISPALFVENQGQWSDSEVRFAHDGLGTNVGMTGTGLVFQTFRSLPGDTTGQMELNEFSTSFVGANPVAPQGMQQADTRFNYYLGDPSAWVSGAPSYEIVGYTGLYDGIDFVTWGLRSQLKYEFHVAPGADPGQIQVRYDGIAGLSLAKDGSLVVDLGDGWGTVVDDAPIVYQDVNGERVGVAARFVLVDPMTYGFEVTGAYDPTQPLVIDPALMWNTYLGGVDADRANDILVDTPNNNVWVAGQTSSPGWVSGGIDTVLNGQDAFLVRMTLTGQHTWSTYLGGAGLDAGYGVAIDRFDDPYVVGYTDSVGWLNGGYDTTYGGAGDGFVVSLDDINGSIYWSSFIGGSAYDRATSIAVDNNDRVYVTGETMSPGWTLGGYDVTFNGQRDAFVVQLDVFTGAHYWSTYVGGTNADSGYDIAVNLATGDTYITGVTYSSGWVSGGFDMSFNGVSDAFVIYLTSAGTHMWSTFLGGGAQDLGNGIFLSGTSLYVAGYTDSPGWVTGGFDTTYNGSGDGFVARMTTTGTRTWETYFGGTGYDAAHDVAVNASGAFIIGTTESQGIQYGGFDTDLSGQSDAFVAKLSLAGTSRLWASYLGGAYEEEGNAIALSTTGDVYVAGSTESANWVLGGFDTTHNGDYDGFVARIADTPVVIVPPVITSLALSPNPVYPPAWVTMTANGVTDADGTVVRVEFYFDDGDLVYDAGDTLLGADTNGGNGWSWMSSSGTWPVGGLSRIHALAQDNSGAWSTPVTATIMVGSTPPVIGGLTAVPDPVTRPNPFTLTATGVTDADGTVTLVNFYRDANGNTTWDAADFLVGSGTDMGGGVWTFAGNATGTAGWTLGPHTVFARPRDNTGTWGTAVSTTLTVNGVNAAPTLASLAARPVGGQFGDPVTRPDPVELIANGVADPDGLVRQVEFYLDDGNSVWDAADTLLGTDDYGVNGWSLTAGTAGWTLGPHTFFARVVDNDGANSAPAVAFAIVQRPIILVGDGQAKSLTYTDPDGTRVRVQLRGGVLDLDFGGNWTLTGGPKGLTLNGAATLDAVVLLGTTGASQLSFKASGGDGMATLGDMTGAGSLGRVDARSMQLVGDVALAGAIGDMRLLGTGPDPNSISVLSMGRFTVARWLEATRLTSLNSIGAIVIGGARNSSVFVGVAVNNDVNGDGVFDLPAPASDFAARFGIGSIVVTGKVWDKASAPTGAPREPSFVNSNFAAWDIGSIVFSHARTNNGAWPFGFAMRTLGSFTYFDSTVAVQQSAPYVLIDLEIRVA
ncbi:MAG: hypothetical protein FJ291_20855 [Planctomycetes bacterium]|nr:hypothetical protein [Planctomycetota bacterium]